MKESSQGEEEVEVGCTLEYLTIPLIQYGLGGIQMYLLVCRSRMNQHQLRLQLIKNDSND